ncbi:MAG: orotidine-5'-phosphate decarboxylase [Candidatus Tectomicrobia bacterium]|uniref:Orotidine 5'-phosphate decarboxylase n=1 Tax=Tectimicrobiota bacterium TaxID=2528274 RepID=A0A932LZ99_UNCTE|nr:orotidine-5'-phosphate decarboxylase [Candidatus Tectomicrobia bacterium]
MPRNAWKPSLKDRLVFALDVDDLEEARQWIDALRGEVGTFKVGLQLFTRIGPEGVRGLMNSDLQIFLDLKLHDIPHTVAQASRGIAALGARMFTVHTLGGTDMLAACAEAIAEEAGRLGLPRPLILGVTLLTSLDEAAARALGFNRKIRDQTLRLAALARQAGLDGVVASSQEVESIKKACGSEFLAVVPGIRPTEAGEKADDQKRTGTPLEAVERGADFLVVGRPLRQSSHPAQTAREIVEEIRRGWQHRSTGTL